MSWEEHKAKVWGEVLTKQRVVRVEPAKWPRVCEECGGEQTCCWKCHGTGEDEPESALTVVFSNGAELVIRSEFAAALFMKKAE